jgi:BirA family biotin operon repressor/biotin-[acetyl-CoA-carboxylase] ligase
VVLAETFRTELRLPAKIKWPNDVYIGGRKVAGILTELSAEVDSINFIIMGIGINVNTNIEELPLSLRNKVTSLKLEIGTKIARVQLLQALLLKLEHFYTEYLRRGSGFVLDRWRQFALYLGQQVQVLTSHENFVGKAIDIDEYGALLVEVKPGVVRRVLAGDVSLRPESYEK